MPQRHEHLARGQENEKLALSLNPSLGFHVDWAITMLFYAALHYIDAFLVGKNFHPIDHENRDSEIHRNGSLTDIYRDYRRLKDMSREARYNIANYTSVHLETAKNKLARIRQHLSAKL